MEFEKELKSKTKDLLEYLREDKEKMPPITSILTTDTEKELIIQLKYSQNFLKHKLPTIYTENYILKKKKQKLKKINLPSSPSSQEYIFESQCPSNDSIIIRGKKKEKKNYLEIWEKAKVRSIIEITPFFEFLYLDDIFGFIEWNQKGDKIIFCAEKKVEENIEFGNLFGENFEKNYDGYVSQNNKLKGFSKPADHRYEPAVFVFDLESNQVLEVENCKSEDFFALSPIFCGDGVVFVGLVKDHFQYTNVYCYNREKSLYFLKNLELNLCTDKKKDIGDNAEDNDKINQEKLKGDKNNNNLPIKITHDVWTVFDPFFSEDYSKIYFTGRKEQFYEHNTCYQLFELNFTEFLSDKKPCSNLLIDVVNENTNSFNGIYKIRNDFGNFFRIKNFKNNILINTAQNGKDKIYYYNLEQKKLIKHPIDNNEDSYNILTQTKDHLIITKTSEKNISELLLIKGLTPKSHPLKTLNPQNFQNPILSPYLKTHQTTTTKKITLKPGSEALLYLCPSPKKRPLLIHFHGGPFSHSQMLKTYSTFTTMFLHQGINLLIINYKGSTSYGLTPLSSLIQQCGKVDVEDSIALIKKCLELYKDDIDEQRVGVYGASHGGFLAGWMITHPEFCRVVSCSAIVNGVLFGPSVLTGSSLPDWGFACFATEKKRIEWPVSLRDLGVFYESTPVLRVRNVMGPCLVVNGQKDSTVCEQNGMYFYNCLRHYRDDCRVVNYPNDYHSLGTYETALHFKVTVFNWFVRHLLKK